MSIINIYNCDCLEFMADKQENAYDLAIVDPPYGLLDSGAQKGGVSEKFKNRIYKNGVIDKWDKKPPSKYFISLKCISKHQIIWGGNYFDLPPTRCVIFW